MKDAPVLEQEAQLCDVHACVVAGDAEHEELQAVSDHEPYVEVGDGTPWRVETASEKKKKKKSHL